MKKILMLFLSLMMVMSLCGCSAKPDKEKEVEEPVVDNKGDDVVVGAYENILSNPALFDEDLQNLFDNATSIITGVDLKPVALLSTQVVSGTNYAFLCESTSVTANPKVKYVIAYVYEDLNGVSDVIGISDLVIDSEENSTEEVVGGWTVCENTYADPNEDCKKVLEKALVGFTGADYQLVTCMSHQVVSGMNHKMLCKETLVTKEPISMYSIVSVYESLDGNCTISDVERIVISLDTEAGAK